MSLTDVWYLSQTVMRNYMEPLTDSHESSYGTVTNILTVYLAFTFLFPLSFPNTLFRPHSFFPTPGAVGEWRGPRATDHNDGTGAATLPHPPYIGKQTSSVTRLGSREA